MEPATYVSPDGITHTICAVTLAGLRGDERPWAITSCGVQLDGYESLEVRVATCVTCLWSNALEGVRGVWVSIDKVRDVLKIADPRAYA